MKFFLANPVATRFLVTNHFNRPRPYANGRHEGIDLRALEDGKPVAVLAAQRGVVDRIRWGKKTGYGNYIRLRHKWADSTTWVTWYGHLAALAPNIREGDFVELGQRLGTAGTTGRSTGVHLHLTLQHLGHGLKGYIVNDVVNPLHYFTDMPAPEVSELTFVTDETVPNGTIVEAGRRFSKQWRIRNTGTQPWAAGYELVHFSDELMDGPEVVALPPLKPGEFGLIAIDLTAPAQPGRHRTTWKGRDPEGDFLSFPIYADFVVSPVPRNDRAVFLKDVTIPDGTAIEPGADFLKTWRVRNAGDTTWDIGYSLAFHSEEQMGAADRVSVPRLRSGNAGVLSVALKAPQRPGVYRSMWRMRNAVGELFGDFLFAEIKVEARPDFESTRDSAACVEDITIPPGTRMAPREPFVKTWRVCNTGHRRWGDGFALAHVGGRPMGTGAAVPLPEALPGETVEVSVALKAPATPGIHQSTWQARGPAGDLFGELLTVEIQVVRLGVRDDARFIDDITVPDGTVVEPGNIIQKIWRLRNEGNSAWVPGYDLAFVDGVQMSGPDSVMLPMCLPGEEIEVTVRLKTPRKPGTYRSVWRPRNTDGQLFGDLFFAEIEVLEAGQPPTSKDDGRLSRHVTIPNGTEFGPGETMHKIWSVKNTGTTTWGNGYSMAHIDGARLAGPESVPVGAARPGEYVRVTVDLLAPATPGHYVSRWRLRNHEGSFFGTTFFVSIQVVERHDTIDLLPYLRGDGRLYEMKYIFQTPAGLHLGQQRVQTQSEGRRFYLVKNREWEELWFDDNYIYRGTDTSPGGGNFYTLMEENLYGSPWVPRHMGLGKAYRRSPSVISRQKEDCAVNFQLSGKHVTWITLEDIHERFTLPNVEGRRGGGIVVRDVVVLAAWADKNGRPADHPFEKYYYAKGFGLVLWQGIDVDHIGKSFLVEKHRPGDRPDNVREHIPCLDSLVRKRDNESNGS